MPPLLLWCQNNFIMNFIKRCNLPNGPLVDILVEAYGAN